jgi:5-methylcytosine-specific restriction enzyme A
MTRRPGKWALQRREWQAVRHAVLERDGWRCRHCGRRGRLEVHHTKRVADFPEHAFNPHLCLTLCPPCHTIETNRELGNKPDPERQAWRKAVAALAKPNRAMETTNA